MARIRRYLGRVEVWLDDRERSALLHSVEALRDAAVAMRPHAYDDSELEDEYQRYSAPAVGELHAADLATVCADLGGNPHPLRLDEERALAWLRALNVLRLTAGGKLGIEKDGWEESAVVGPGQEETWSMFLDLGWVQEGILAALEG
ncbi:MAG TPA: DUF2017 family protein [Candidatus Dormibacteraeota bacterium]|nr:DUF2017 family protein [Candidatus Dormibacteraeota bacterium]